MTQNNLRSNFLQLRSDSSITPFRSLCVGACVLCNWIHSSRMRCVCVSICVLFQYTPSLNTSLFLSLTGQSSFPLAVYLSLLTHVSLEVVGSHSTLNSGRAVKRKRCLCAAPRLHYSIGLGLHAVYLLIRPTIVLLSVKGFAQSVTVKGGLLLFLLPKLIV